MKRPLLISDTSKEHFKEARDLLIEAGIEFDTVNVIEDKYYYPAVSHEIGYFQGLMEIEWFIELFYQNFFLLLNFIR